MDFNYLFRDILSNILKFCKRPPLLVCKFWRISYYNNVNIDEKNDLIRWASTYGHTELVKLLLCFCYYYH